MKSKEEKGHVWEDQRNCDSVSVGVVKIRWTGGWKEGKKGLVRDEAGAIRRLHCFVGATYLSRTS